MSRPPVAGRTSPKGGDTVRPIRRSRHRTLLELARVLLIEACLNHGTPVRLRRRTFAGDEKQKWQESENRQQALPVGNREPCSNDHETSLLLRSRQTHCPDPVAIRRSPSALGDRLPNRYRESFTAQSAKMQTVRAELVLCEIRIWSRAPVCGSWLSGSVHIDGIRSPDRS